MDITHWFHACPRELAVILIAMLPVAELRGAIPWAVHPQGGGMSLGMAYVLAVTGNAIPVIPLLLGLGPVSNYLRRWPVFDRFFEWLFARTRRRGNLVERYEALGLVPFVAIPLPVTGAWTGAVAAFVFGVRFRYALPAILAGILIAGLVVVLACAGVIGIWGIASS
ncbi:MAG: small multi-drug export protein [Candidatus Eisenbacteria sp.]|nr:small multi-drug export protein [Candidatus Eisenbacteria bacterium]